MVKRIYKYIAAGLLFVLAVALSITLALLGNKRAEASGESIDGLFTGNAATVTQNERLPSYIEKIEYNGKIYDNSEIAAVKMQSDGKGKTASVKYNRIIDLTDSTKNLNLLDFVVANKTKLDYDPSATIVTQDMYDFRYFNVRFTDVYDSSNYLEMNFERRNDFRHISSIRVSTNTHVSAGWYPSAGALRETPYGTPLLASFAGAPSNADGVYKVISTSYDESENAVYASPFQSTAAQTLIRDLDDPEHLGKSDNLWGGFTTGEVYLSFEFATIRDNSQATVYLFALNGQSFIGESIVDVTAPSIRLNDRTKERDIPLAETGCEYKMFDVNAYDLFDGKLSSENILKKVYYDYNGKRKDVSIQNGAFVPAEAGAYTLYYEIADKAGNVGRKTVEVTAKTKLSELMLSVDADYDEIVYVGETVALQDKYVAAGGSGSYEYSMYVENLGTGKKIYPKSKNVVFETAGYYDIVYSVTDYIGRQKLVKYTVKAEIGEKPLITLSSMPSVYIVGKDLILPDFSAKDFYSFGQSAVEANKEYLVSTDGWNTYKSYKVGDVLNFAEMGTVNYKLRASSVVNGEFVTESDSFELTVIKPLSIGEYFYDKSGKVALDYSDTENPMYTTSSASELVFANALAASTFNFNFVLTKGRCNFTAFELNFRDTEKDDAATVLISKKDEKVCNIYLNGNFVAELNARFAEDERFSIYVSDNLLYINSAYVCRLLGKASSDILSNGKTYFSFAFKNVKGTSAVKVTRLNNQTYMGLPFDGQSNFDSAAPIIIIKNGIKTIYNIGDEVVVPAAVGADVLDPAAEISVEILCDGKTVYSKSGISQDYSFIANKPADYFVVYTAKDSSGNMSRLNYTVHVCNRTKPTLTVNGTVSSSAKVGEAINLPAASAKDYFGNDLSVAVLVTAPDGKVETCKDGKVKIEKKGAYRIKFVCVDADYNYTAREYVVRGI